jgi:hypothetical protein
MDMYMHVHICICIYIYACRLCIYIYFCAYMCCVHVSVSSIHTTSIYFQTSCSWCLSLHSLNTRRFGPFQFITLPPPPKSLKVVKLKCAYPVKFQWSRCYIRIRQLNGCLIWSVLSLAPFGPFVSFLSLAKQQGQLAHANLTMLLPH